jgi:hypothetical protein
MVMRLNKTSSRALSKISFGISREEDFSLRLFFLITSRGCKISLEKEEKEKISEFDFN